MKSIVFKALFWSFEDKEGELLIHISGHTETLKTVQVIVKGFAPYAYLELPERIKWTKQKAAAVYEYFEKILSVKPISYKPVIRYKLHYRKKMWCLLVRFPTWAGCRNFEWKCSGIRNAYIPRVGSFKGGDFKVHEHRIDPIIKFTASKKIELAGWISAEKLDDSEKFSSADIDFFAHCDDVQAATHDFVNIQPSFCSFDIECYSQNHNSKLPDPTKQQNVVFQIALIFGRLGEENCKKVLLSLGNPHDIDEVEVIRYPQEKDLLLGFTKLVQREDPDIFIGYNIIKFDWNYLIYRSQKLGINFSFMKLSRLLGEPAEEKKFSWESGAYGEQTFRFPVCHGRIHVDALIEVERNHKLPKYSLDAVSKKFLGEQKDDITPRQLFMLWQLSSEFDEIAKGEKADVELVRSRVSTIFPARKTHGVVAELRQQLLTCPQDQIEWFIRQALTLTGKYCVQDTVLPVRLIEKLNLWTTMEQMANVMNIPMSYLHTRGQQIKVLAQVYRETIFNNIVIPHNRKPDEERFRGATVFEAIPGDYDNVGTLDFASLYPSTMIAFNICYTTIVTDSDPVPDEKCHVLTWETHQGCECDPLKRKKKKDKIICESRRYRFRKVEIVDGTRLGEGLLPQLERKLLSTRREIKKEMFAVEAKLKMQRGQATPEEISSFRKFGYDIIEPSSLDKREEKALAVSVNVLNAKQLAVKVSANSVYGAMGAREGFMPFIAGAASVTAMGRKLIELTVERIKKEWSNCKLVYGDSVTPDTPVICRLDGKVFVRTIDNVGGGHVHFFGEKEEVEFEEGMEVWTDTGFTPLKRIIRHKTGKKIYRVITRAGVVKVTEDHSLLNDRAEKVKPSQVKVGDRLLVSPNPRVGGNLHIPDAWVWGFFFGREQSRARCERAKKMLKEKFPKLNFLLCKKSGLIPEKFDPAFEKWRPRTIPDQIFSADRKSRSQFLKGVGVSVCKGQIGSMGLYLLASSLGYKISVNTRSDKPEIYRLTLTKNSQRKSAGVVKKIECLGTINDHVYDLETENHHFAAGVGQLIVHNTDSCMIIFSGTTLIESFDLCKQASKIATHYLKCWIIGIDESYKVGGWCRLDNISSKSKEFAALSLEDQTTVLEYEATPIDLEFENMYGRFLLLTRKRYIAHVVNRDAKVIYVAEKGVVLVRRDNCAYLRKTYKKLTDGILNRIPEEEFLYALYDEITSLFSRRVPDTDLIIYMGIKTLLGYAEKKTMKQGNRTVTYHVDRDGECIDDVVGPLDPRLVYPNLPQCILALKMLKRGTELPPNTRLEYIYIENPVAVHQGEKAEDFTYYQENRKIENLRPDYLYYLEKQLTKPITELINVKFPREIVICEDLDVALEKCLKAVTNAVKLYRLANAGKFEKIPQKVDLCCGWEASGIKRPAMHLSQKRRVGYSFRGKEAKVTFILDSAKKPGVNEFSTDERLVNLCKRWKAREVLNRVRRFHGVKKAPSKRCTLCLHATVILQESYGGREEGERGKVVGVDKEECKCSVAFPEVITGIPFEVLVPYYVRDNEILEGVLKARESYKKVVEHIAKLCG